MTHSLAVATWQLCSSGKIVCHKMPLDFSHPSHHCCKPNLTATQPGLGAQITQLLMSPHVTGNLCLSLSPHCIPGSLCFPPRFPFGNERKSGQAKGIGTQTISQKNVYTNSSFSMFLSRIKAQTAAPQKNIINRCLDRCLLGRNVSEKVWSSSSWALTNP